MQSQFTPFPVLTTKRLLLRQISPDDQHEIWLMRNHPAVNQFLERPKSYSEKDIADFINRINKGIGQNEWINWAIALKEKPEKLIGTICLWNLSVIDNSAETGYELQPQHQGKGIMHEALITVLDYAFKTMQLSVVHAYTHLNNNPSVNLLIKTGFTRNEFQEQTKENPDEVVYSIHPQ